MSNENLPNQVYSWFDLVGKALKSSYRFLVGMILGGASIMTWVWTQETAIADLRKFDTRVELMVRDSDERMIGVNNKVLEMRGDIKVIRAILEERKKEN
jgi:hypothetical protein